MLIMIHFQQLFTAGTHIKRKYEQYRKDYPPTHIHNGNYTISISIPYLIRSKPSVYVKDLAVDMV